MRLDVHYHALVLDGVYTGFDPRGNSLRFHAAKRLTNDEVTALVRHIATMINGHVRRRGYLDEDLTLVDESGEDFDEALGMIGKIAKSALPQLRNLAKSDDNAKAARAWAAIRAIER